MWSLIHQSLVLLRKEKKTHKQIIKYYSYKKTTWYHSSCKTICCSVLVMICCAIVILYVISNSREIKHSLVWTYWHLLLSQTIVTFTLNGVLQGFKIIFTPLKTSLSPTWTDVYFLHYVEFPVLLYLFFSWLLLSCCSEVQRRFRKTTDSWLDCEESAWRRRTGC